MRIVTKLLNKINVDDNTIVQVQNYDSYFAQLSQVLSKTPTKFVKTFKYKYISWKDSKLITYVFLTSYKYEIITTCFTWRNVIIKFLIYLFKFFFS